MTTFRLTLAYDGTGYHGWQAQPNRPTIQGALEGALRLLSGREVRVRGAGRTDAGVHALGQVAAFSLETRLTPAAIARALNARLPDDIAVLAASEVADDFHPARDAVRKMYRYLIDDGSTIDPFRRRYCWLPRRGPLDVDAMRRAGQALVGIHDFRSFQSAGSPRESTVRTVFDLRVERAEVVGDPLIGVSIARGAAAERDRAGQGGLIALEIEADGFLYNMARAIVGTLVEIGRGARPIDFAADALGALRRGAAGPTAPPQGLFLVRVDYAVPSSGSRPSPCASPTSSPE